MAGDEGGGWRRQEHYRAGYFHGFADAVQACYALDHVGAESGIGERFVGAWRGDEGGRDGVYRDVVLAPFDGQAFGEMRDRGFAGAIDGFRRQRGKSGLRAHVDDAAAVLADHDFRGSLRGEERCFQIDGEGGVEFMLGDVEGQIGEAVAGVIDEDVELAEMRGGVSYAAGDLIEMGNIHLQRKGAAAHGFDLACETGPGADVAQAQCDVGSDMGKREGNGASQAACRGGDQGNFAGEIKFGKFWHCESFALLGILLLTLLARRSQWGEQSG